MNKRPKKRKYRTRNLDKYPFYPWIEKTSVYKIANIISALLFGFLILVATVGVQVFDEPLPPICAPLLVIGMFIMIAFIGYATILKRETPEPSPVKGKAAVVYGWIYLGICGIVIIVMMVVFLIELFSNS